MLKATIQNIVLVTTFALGATIGGMCAPMLMSSRGELGPGVFEAVSLGRAGVAAIAVLVASLLLGCIAGRVCNTVVGAFVMGGGLFGFTWRLESVHEIAFTGSLTAVAIETVVWSGLVLAAVVVLFRVSGPLPDVHPAQPGVAPSPFFSADAFKSAAAGALVLPAVWLIAQSDDKGQVIGAVFCGGMAAGLVGRILAPHVQPVLIFATPVLFGAIGHVIGAAALSEPLREAMVADRAGALIMPMPVDYAAGSLLGVAMGLGWAKSFLHHEEEHGAVKTATG